MERLSTALLIALLAASCGDGTSANDSGIDAGSDTDTDTDIDTDTDTDTDADTDCECDSPDDAYCDTYCHMMLCDGCHFEEVDCCDEAGETGCHDDDLPECGGDPCECDTPNEGYCADDCLMMLCGGCYYEEVDCCEDVEAIGCEEDLIPDCEYTSTECPGGADCYPDAVEDMCYDELTLEECVGPSDCGHWEMTSCYDPIGCPGGSGCDGEPDTYGGECWCDTTVDDPDGGTDAGADGGV
jgi:hypothetical protein